MNVGDLFDSPLKIAIVAVVIIVLFGSKKLPGAARSLGQSMRILKKEVQGLHEDEKEPAAPAPAGPATVVPPAQLTAPAPAGPATVVPPAPLTAPAPQSQIDALQQQIRDLQRAATMGTVPADGSRTGQPTS
jgi:sec-independent protein translocase protein TatA